VELGGIEPPSIGQWKLVLRPFPTLRLTLSHRRVGLAVSYPAALAPSLRSVSRLSGGQQALLRSSPASVAGLRWIGPVRHCWSRCLSTP
jgi:hypothetical protein